MRDIFVQQFVPLLAQELKENDQSDESVASKSDVFCFQTFSFRFRFISAGSSSLLLLKCSTFSLSCVSDVNEKGRFAVSR